MRSASRVTRLGPICHAVFINETRINTKAPLNQINNMANAYARSQINIGVTAIAVVSNMWGRHQNIVRYLVGYIAASGVNIALFADLGQAKEWLNRQPHRHDCKCKERRASLQK
jgi:hypothetical protein